MYAPQNGFVNAADYTVWRDTLNQSGIGLAADGSGNGTVGDSDFSVWAANFGDGTGSGAGAAVPEPATLVMLAMGMLAIFSCRRW